MNFGGLARNTPLSFGLYSLALLAAYIATGRLGLQFAYFGGHVTAIWPPSGIALAAILLGGYRYLPAIFLGAAVVPIFSGVALTGCLLMGVGNTASAALGAWLLRRVARFDPTLSGAHDVLALIAMGALLGPLLAASGGATALVFAGSLPAANYWEVWTVWWTGDALGVVVFTPLLLCLGSLRRFEFDRRPLGANILLLGAQTLICALTFTSRLDAWAGVHAAGAFLAFPFALWLALSAPLPAVALANLLTCGLAAWGAVHGVGPFAHAQITLSLHLLQAFALVFCLTTLSVHAVKAAQRRFEQSLRESQVRFEHFTSISADWCWEQNADLRFTYNSQGWSRRPGALREAVLGRTRFELPYVWRSEEQERHHEADLAARRPFYDLQLGRQDADGKLRYVSLSGVPLFDAQGTFCGYRGVGHDITAEREATDVLQQSEARLRSLVELSADWMWEQDEQLRFTYFGGGVRQKAGVDVNNAIGKTRFELSLGWESERIKAQHAEVLAARRSFYDLRLKRLDDSGQLRHMSVSGVPIFDAAGKFTGYRGVAHDITTVTLAIEALRASESRFRSLVELSSDWYWEQDEHYRFTVIAGASDNPAIAEYQALIGKTRWDLPISELHAERLQAHQAMLHRRESFRDLELSYRLRSGQVMHVAVSGTPLFDAQGKFQGYRGTSRDITERKLTEERLNRLSDLYVSLSEVNHAILHAQDETSLFREVCRIAVEHGHMLFARITMLERASGHLQTIAFAGGAHDFDQRFPVSMDAKVPEGQGPTGDALRSGENFVCNDVSAETRLGPWRHSMQAVGSRALANFLLRREAEIVGVLHLYADQTGFFDAERTALLEKLAANLCFALDNFQRERARRAAEEALRESEVRFRDFADAAGEYVWENDLTGCYLYVSSRVEALWGYSAHELIGRTPAQFMPPGEAERVREWLVQHTQADGSFRDLESMIVTKSGATRWSLINAVGVFDDRGRRTGQRGTGRDITDRKTAEARITHLATRDALTELPNRVLFNDRLEQGIVTARRSGQSLALMFIDLDRFKNINDSLGHQVGDLLLKEVAARMLNCVRKGDTLSRLGGDEFVVTLDGLLHAEDAAQVAAKIIRTLARPMDIAGHTLTTSCSIGISIFPLDADDDRALMKNADTAMYHAKEKGRNNYQFFSPEMNERAVERHSLEAALRLAIERQEFVLHFQPQMDIASNRITGVEALLRWQHPERGLLSPTTFIAVAEESGLIEPIGQWVLRGACQRAKAWQDAGYPAIKMAVNISARQLNRPREFSRGVARILSGSGLDPRYLELEMTESLLLQNVEENIAALRRLGQDGVRIAVDDFGTGYSSLSYLRQLPIDSLKIDRSFVRGLDNDPGNTAIIQAIVAMAHGIHLQVTAEGVETRAQLEALRQLGCDEYQGYLFSKPLPATEIAARFLANGELDLRVSNS